MLPIIFFLSVLFHSNIPAPATIPGERVLAVKTMSLDNRYPVQPVNEVFKQNILLTLAYMRQKTVIPFLDANSVDKPMYYELTLHQGETFAFHDTVLPEYNGKVVATTNAHFNSREGFKSDGYLIGDGVCHLASLIGFAAQSAGLGVTAPTSHDFANIPDVPKQYGVSIYAIPSDPLASARQNLYITNTFSNDITMVFDYHDSVVKVSIVKQTS